MRKNVNLSDLEDVTKQKSFKNCELFSCMILPIQIKINAYKVYRDSNFILQDNN